MNFYQSTSLFTQSLSWIKAHLIHLLSLFTLGDPCHVWLFTPPAGPANVSVERFISHHYLFKDLYCLLATVFHTYKDIVITYIKGAICTSIISSFVTTSVYSVTCLSSQISLPQQTPMSYFYFLLIQVVSLLIDCSMPCCSGMLVTLSSCHPSFAWLMCVSRPFYCHVMWYIYLLTPSGHSFLRCILFLEFIVCMIFCSDGEVFHVLWCPCNVYV